MNAASRARRRTVVWLGVAVAAMFGFGYAMVPLYYVLCDLTGLGGRTNNLLLAADELGGAVDSQRTVTVEFVANLASGAPWEFRPALAKLDVHPGEFYRVSFIAKNLTHQALVGQAVPSVAPGQAALHFQKIQCFCFDQQQFEPGASKDMPVVFRVDPELPAHIETVTLSYTFFKLDSDS